MTAALSDIEAVLADCFEGLHHSDTSRLRGVFHPEAICAPASEGALRTLRMEAYWALVDQRPSSASRSETRTDRILSIECAGPVTAWARLQCSIRPRHFTDLLTLVHVEGRWQVLAKVFHVDVEPAIPASGEGAEAPTVPSP